MEENGKPVVLRLVKPPEGIAETMATLACPTPREIDEHLEALGVRGQAEARAAVSTLAFRHTRRLHQEFVHSVPRSSLPGRSALLLTGPAGCGKTLLVELLCREVLEIPAVVVDVPSLAACATVDHVIGKVLSQLLDAAGGNKARASMGVVCLDGLEKVACPVSEEAAAKASPDWVLRNWRVQRALHTLLTADSVRFHHESGHDRGSESVWFPFLRNTFIACGDIEGKKAAFLPELLGAFQRKVELAPLGRTEFEAILGDLVQRLRREIEPGFTVAPSREELDGIVRAALEGGEGARTLRAEVEYLVESVVHPQEEGGNR